MSCILFFHSYLTNGETIRHSYMQEDQLAVALPSALAIRPCRSVLPLGLATQPSFSAVLSMSTQLSLSELANRNVRKRSCSIWLATPTPWLQNVSMIMINDSRS